MLKQSCSEEMAEALELFFDYRLKNEKIQRVSFSSDNSDSYKSVPPSKYAKNFVSQLVMDVGPKWSRDAEIYLTENKCIFSVDEIDDISVKNFAYNFYSKLIESDNPSYANAWLKSSLANNSNICENVSFQSIVRLGYLGEYLSKNVVESKSSVAAIKKLNDGVMNMIDAKDEKSLATVSSVLADFISESLKKPLNSYEMPFFVHFESVVCFELSKFDKRWNEFPQQRVKTSELFSGKAKDVNFATAVFLSLCGSSMEAITGDFDGLHNSEIIEKSSLYFKFQENVNLYDCAKQISDEFNDRVIKSSLSDAGLSPLSLLSACKEYHIDFPQEVNKNLDLYLYQYYGRLGGVDEKDLKKKNRVDSIVGRIEDGSLDYWLGCYEELKSLNKISSEENMILPLYRKWLNHKIVDKIEVESKPENNKDYKL